MTGGTICDRRRTASASTSSSLMSVGSNVTTLTSTRVASWRRRTAMTAAIITTNMMTPYVLLLLLMSISMSMMSLFDFRVRVLTNHIAVSSIGDRGGADVAIVPIIAWYSTSAQTTTTSRSQRKRDRRWKKSVMMRSWNFVLDFDFFQ
jgi:hypothetical protein